MPRHSPPGRFLAIGLALAGTASLSTLAAQPATLPPQTASYSATAVFDIDGRHYHSTISADHGRERRVVDTPYGAQTLLINPAEGKAYLLQRQIGALSLDLSSPEAGISLARLYGAPAVPVAQETLSGLRVTKYRLDAEVAPSTPFSGFVWATPDGILVQADGTGTYRDRSSRIVMRLSNISRGPQDPSAFSLPAGTPVMDADPIVKQLLEQPGDSPDR